MNAFQMDTVKNDTFSIPNNTIERLSCRCMTGKQRSRHVC